MLAALGAVQLINGLWALLAPWSFSTEFPLGRGWVELLPASDATVNAVVLIAAVVLPAWVLAAVTRRRRATRPPRQPVANRSSSGRITGISDDTRNLLTRLSFRESRRRYGAVMEPMRVFAHHPKVPGMVNGSA